MVKRIGIIGLLSVISIWGIGWCSDTPTDKHPVNLKKRDTIRYEKLRAGLDTSWILGSDTATCRVRVKTPQTQPSKGVIILLPGWNYPVTDWCSKTKLCTEALQQGYTLVLLDMQKSIYSSQLYPQTRADWRRYRTRRWITDTVIPFFEQKYHLLAPQQANYILGLSTGGRGVALLCLDMPTIFRKAASLSGDFDQTLMQTDPLMIGFYGSLSTYTTRWTGADNPARNASGFRTPIYIGHGLADKVVPCNQSIHFADTLRKLHPTLPVILHIDSTAGHNYQYWNSEINAVLRFFDQ